MTYKELQHLRAFSIIVETRTQLNAVKGIGKAQMPFAAIGTADTTQGLGFELLLYSMAGPWIRQSRTIEGKENLNWPAHFVTALQRWVENEDSILILMRPESKDEMRNALNQVTDLKLPILDWKQLCEALKCRAAVPPCGSIFADANVPLVDEQLQRDSLMIDAWATQMTDELIGLTAGREADARVQWI